MSTVKTVKDAGKFSWNAENTSRVVELYQNKLKSDGALIANETSFLAEIAKDVGAKSAVSVRTKLSNEGAYEKSEVPRKVGGGTSFRKTHYVRALVAACEAKGMETTLEDLESLEAGKVSALQIMIELVDAQELLKAQLN